MKNKISFVLIIVVSLLLICSCTSTANGGLKSNDSYSAWNLKNAEDYDKIFSLFNSYGGSVCMGVSGPNPSREKAIELATERCVQYLAFYRGLAMQVDFGTVIDSTMEDTSIEYSVIGGTINEKLAEAIDDFEIVDIEWLGERIGAVVFARLPEMKTVKTVKNVLGSPIPSINGFYVAVATSENSYSTFYDAIEAATFRVAQELVSVHNGTLTVVNSITNSTTENFRNDSYSISGNRLEGFSVLAYEYNIEENKVYALAVCKK